MQRKELKQLWQLSSLGWGIFLITLILTLFGLVMVLGASGPVGERFGGGPLFYFWRQLLAFFLGLIFLIGGLAIDYHFWQKSSGWALALLLVLLFLVFIPGLGTTHGTASSRWIDLGPLTFQASEIAKILLIMVLAAMLVNKESKIRDFISGLLPVLAVLGLVIGLVMAQPDLGTTIVVFLSSFTLLFLAGIRFSHFFLVGTMMLPGILWFILKHPYQRERLTAFLNPWADPRGKGFQIIQSLLSLGSGGWAGVGLGQSRQKYSYLPQQFTDFIFSIIGEELGLVGTVIVLALFAVLVFLGLKVAAQARDPYGRYLAAGIVALIGWQALVNIGVASGSLPVTGIPLPLISYGGTALVMFLGSLGVLLNISKNAS